MTYSSEVREITIVDGVEADIEVRATGDDERKADSVMMDLQERMGVLQYAYENEVPPSEIDDVPNDYKPMMTNDWESMFGEEQ